MTRIRVHRKLSIFLLWVQSMLLLHAATPHAHAGGGCGHQWAHAEAEAAWYDAVVACLHDWIHHHEDSSACDDLDELFRPVETSRSVGDRDVSFVHPASVVVVHGAGFVVLSEGRLVVPLEVLALTASDGENVLCWRGPPASLMA